jgi:multiple sugar transport system ATP-binding protein
VMKGGVIQQLDDPDVVYNRPANRFVASFLGSPPMNFIPGELVDNGGFLAMRTGDMLIPLPHYESAPDRNHGRSVILGVRPEHVAIAEAAATQEFQWNVNIQLRESLGSEVLLWSSLGGAKISIRANPESNVREGQIVSAGFSSFRVSIFDAKSGERL